MGYPSDKGAWGQTHPPLTKYTKICVKEFYCFTVVSYYPPLQEAFTAFHNDEQYVRKFMKAIHIGQIGKEHEECKDVVKDFAELRKTAEKMVSI